MLVVSVAKDVILNHRLPRAMNLLFHLLLIVIAIAGILIKSSRVQLVLALAGVAGFLAYVGLLFARL